MRTKRRKTARTGDRDERERGRERDRGRVREID